MNLSKKVLETELFHVQKKTLWPSKGKVILGQFDNESVRKFNEFFCV